MPQFFCFSGPQKSPHAPGTATRMSSNMLRLTMIPRSEASSPVHNNGAQVYEGDDSITFQTSTPAQIDDMVDNITAMLLQEVSYYACDDYLHSVNKKGEKRLRLTHQCGKRGSSDAPSSGAGKKVDEFCREQISEWSYRVIDFFQVDREVVYIATSYLDRFLMSCTCDRRTYKLAATTALQLAMKVHYPRKMNLSEIITDLSRGEFNMEDVAKMEITMLQALSWRIHPPTPMCYVSRMLMMHPFAAKPIQEFDLDGVQDFAIFFVELSVCDYFFVTQKQSTVALAAVLNALEGLGYWSSASHNDAKLRWKSRYFSAYVYDLCTMLNSSHTCDEIVVTRQRLWDAYERSEEFSLHNDAEQAIVDAFSVPEKRGDERRTSRLCGKDKGKTASTPPKSRNTSSPRSVVSSPRQNGAIVREVVFH